MVRSLRAYTAALTCSSAATALVPLVLAFAVLDLGGSAAEVGWVLAARTAPQVILLLLGGVVADRYGRHLVAVASCAAQAVTLGAAGYLVAARSATIGTLLVLGCANGIAAAFTYPALAGMLPRLVSIKDLPGAASVTGLFARGGAVLGILAAGAAASLALTGSGLLIAGAMMLGAVLAMWLVRLPPPSVSKVDGTRAGVVGQLADGWREFAGHTWLWLTVSGFCVVNMVMAGAWATIGPVIAEHSIGRGAWGVVVAAFTAGLCVGSLALLRFRPRRLLAWGIAGSALTVPAVAGLYVPSIVLLGPMALLAGMGLGFFSAAWRTTLGQRVPADRLSRVSSIDGLGSFAAMPVGQVLAGRLADVTSPRQVALGGAVLAALAVGSMLLPHTVRRLPNLSLDPSGSQAGPEAIRQPDDLTPERHREPGLHQLRRGTKGN
jgi:MFS family permease